jgi:hypothetical protein
LEWSYNYQLEGDRTESIVNLCAQAGASEYVVGPAARAYLDETAFAARGVAVTWFDYAGYPPYPQLWGPFERQVSILDLLFNCGPSAARYMKHVGTDPVHSCLRPLADVEKVTVAYSRAAVTLTHKAPAIRGLYSPSL